MSHHVAYMYDTVRHDMIRQVYVNEFDGCRYSSMKVNESPQLICENVVIEADEDDRDELVRCGTVDGQSTSTEVIVSTNPFRVDAGRLLCNNKHVLGGRLDRSRR